MAEIDVLKEYAELIKDGNELVDLERKIISFSPNLDLITGGGVPEGSIVVLTGAEKIGKTLSSLHLAANAQKEIYASELCPEGRRVYLSSIEARLQPRDIKGIPHLDRSRFHWIQSRPGKILSAEEHLSIGEKLISENPACIFIFDSFSALCTEEEMTSGMDKQQRAAEAKLQAKFLRKIRQIVSVNKSIVIIITHVMSNPSGYGGPQEKTSRALKYKNDLKLFAKKKEWWKLSESGDPIGQIVTWECINSPIGPPGRKIESHIRYGVGIDEVRELIDIAVGAGIIYKKGSWYTYGEKKQGLEKLQKYITEENLVEKLRKDVNDMIYGC